MKNTEKITELLTTLKEHKSKILDHILKEFDFNNEEPIIEKNEVYLERMLKTLEDQVPPILANPDLPTRPTTQRRTITTLMLSRMVLRRLKILTRRNEVSAT